MEFELVDLRDYPMPFFDEPMSPLWAPLKSGVHVGGADAMDLLVHGKSLTDKPHLVPSVSAMFDELAWWTGALKQARAEG